MKFYRLRTVLRAGVCVLLLLTPMTLSASQFVVPESPDWWTVVQADIRQREYYVSWQETPLIPGISAGYQAPNRAHDLRIGFDSTGVFIVPRTFSQQWTLGLALTGLGQEGAVASVGLPTISSYENHVTYRRDSVVEWYTNDESGLEQGFQIPDLNLQSPILLELALTGNLVPHLINDGRGIEFSTADGTPTLRYASPHASDAAGRRLSLALVPQGDRISFLIEDDSAATYPITLRTRITALPSVADWIGESDQDDAHLGYALSTAGDVNGDGYSDLIVGAPDYDGGQLREGAVFVYHGGAAGLAASLAWTVESDQENAHLGHAISIAGDVNGDGYADVIVGAPDYDGIQTDEGAAFVYHGSPAGLVTGPADWTATGGQESAHFGSSVSTAGDVDGDGYSDVVVGAPDYDGDYADGGAAFVYHGSSTGLAVGPADWISTGDQLAAHFGAAVSIAGDVNGDGYADVIVGAPDYDAPGGTLFFRDLGQVYVYYGSPTGLAGSADWMVAGLGGNDTYFGAAVSIAGDVNGDGYGDIVIGAPGYDVFGTTTLTDTGMACAYYGSSAGLATGFGTWIEPDWMVTGEQLYAHLGAAVSVAGDVDSDGYADVIVGAPDYDGVQSDEGAAYVYHGGPTGLTAAPIWSAHPTDQESAHFGVSVSTAGDVNGDGHSDLAIGASGYDHEHLDEGGAFVYHGSPSGLSGVSSWSVTGGRNGALIGWSVATAGDVNGDGYADVLVGAPKYDRGQTEEGVAFLYVGGPDGLANSPAWVGEGEQDWAGFGQVVAAAGDVNGDGYADAIVGAPRYDGEQFDDGKAFVYHGGLEGLTADPVWVAPPEGQGTAVFGVSARFGTAVSTAGDVNGDGYADVIVTANGYDAEETNEGAAFVYHGGPTGLDTDPAWTVHPTDQAYANFGRSASTAGDVNGDGYSDVIVGVPWYDNPESSSDDAVFDGNAFVYHGSETGLNTDPAWTFEDLYTNSEFGIAVSTAGDVNGDGYSDVVIGAYKYTGANWREGAALVYHGSSTGLASGSVDWIVVGGQDQAKFGISVSTAGDVNGDGYSDVIVGASNYTNDQTQEGAAFVYYGGATGLATGAADWAMRGDQGRSGYGFTVSAAGDVNGDGYGDVIVGAPTYNDSTIDEGAAFVYLGNGGGGLPVRPNQLRTDGNVPIAPLGRSNSTSQVCLQLTARSPLGREPLALQWQLAPLGVPFTATTAISGTSPAWTDTLTTGVVLSQTVDGLIADTVYRWRVRALYRPGNPLGQPASRWLYLPWNGLQEADFRTSDVMRSDLGITVLLGHLIIYSHPEQFGW